MIFSEKLGTSLDPPPPFGVFTKIPILGGKGSLFKIHGGALRVYFRILNVSFVNMIILKMLAHISDATGFVITFCTVESVLNIEFLEQLVHRFHVSTYSGTLVGRVFTLFAGKSYPFVHNLNVTLQSILITTLEITMWTVKLSFLVHSNHMSDEFP